MRGTSLHSMLLASAVLLIPGSSLAQSYTEAKPDSASQPSSSNNKDRAARLFDQGVLLFSRGQYEQAAQAFLHADELFESPQALMNAVTAAHQANDALLTARAAQRALGRPGMRDAEVSVARQALASVVGRLARVVADCGVSPCSLTLDGEAVSPGVQYVRPGEHEIAANFPNGARAVEHFSCNAGASYDVRLRPSSGAGRATDAAGAASAAPIRATRTPVSTRAGANEAISKASSAHSSGTMQEEASAARAKKPLSPMVFALGCVGTGALAALTTWSGFRVLSERRLHDTNPDAYDPDEVRRLQRQTDLFLLGTIVLGAATGAAGLWWVDFKGEARPSVAFSPGGGVMIGAEKRF